MDRIVGHVDAVTPSAVMGWIANLDQPQRLESVVCEGSTGQKVVVQPFVPRLDVCQALGQAGLYGFAIPTRLLRPLGSAITFGTSNGLALEGGAAIHIPDMPNSDDEVEVPWFVLHIQKTAGTSLRVALNETFKPWEMAFIYPERTIGLSPLEFSNLPIAQRASLRLVIGHVSFSHRGYIPRSAESVTVLREPEARIRSHYYHHLSAGTEFKVNNLAIPIARAVQHALSDEFDNLMTRTISGVSINAVPIGSVDASHVELALENIRNHFAFVGLTESSDQHYSVLCDLMNVSPYRQSNENPRRIADTQDADRQVAWDEVLFRNRFDQMLYDAIKTEGLSGRDLRVGRFGRVCPGIAHSV